MAFLDTLVGQPLWLALFISIIVNILISLVGVLPSAFVTAANIAYFGFVGGLAVSIIGEAVGAVVSFFLYRIGVKKLGEKFSDQTAPKFVHKLKAAAGIEAFFLVMLLRIFPFAPSGLVTLAASLSKMSAVAFAVSSTLGKIPALFIEAYSVNEVLGWKQEYQAAVAIGVLAVLGGYYYRKKWK